MANKDYCGPTDKTVSSPLLLLRLDDENQTIRLSPEGQLAFWAALNEPVRLTEAQKRLGAIMRGCRLGERDEPEA